MRPVGEWLRRIEMLVHGARFDKELDDEMRLHVELREAQLQARGLTSDAARDAAQRRFGNALRLREESRDAWGWAWLEHSMQDFRHGLRLLVKTPLVSLVTTLVLALGIAANTTMFAVVDAVWLQPLPYHEPDRLVHIWEQHPQRGIDRERVAPQNLLDWRARNHVFEEIAYWGAWRDAYDFTVTGMQGSEYVRGAYVSANLFRVLRVQPLLGRPFDAADDERGKTPVAIIGHRLWQRRFGGDPQIVGQVLSLDNYRRRDFTIVGIMPPAFTFPQQVDFWLPGGAMQIFMDRREGPWLMALGRLRDGITLDTARSDLLALQARIAADAASPNVSTRVVMNTLPDETIGRLKPVLLLLQGSVAFVLLVACTNVANLLLAHASGRQAEIAIRAALGAGRTRLLRQLVVESVTRAVVAGVLGVLLATGGMSLIREFGPDTIPRLAEARLNPSVLAFMLLISLATGVIFGLAPALHLTRGELTDNLREGARGATAGRRSRIVRQVLLVSEVALTVMLLVGASLLLQSLYKLQQIDLGFRSERLLTASLDMSGSSYTSSRQPGANRPQVFTERLIASLQATPGIVGAAAADRLPPHERSALAGIVIQAQSIGKETEPLPAVVRAVTSTYFRVMGITLKRGRMFSGHDTEAGPRVAIINETMAKKYFRDTDPIGRSIDLSAGARAVTDDQPVVYHEIVGVVGDVRNAGFVGEVQPEVYKPAFQWPWYKVTLLVRTHGDPSALSQLLREAVHRLNPQQPVASILPMQDVLGSLHAEPRFRTVVVGVFAALALVLATIGIYGVLDYTVASRRHEIGVRVALGASKRTILHTVLGQGLSFVTVGIALGFAGTLFTSKLMPAVLFDVNPWDPITFVAVALFLMLVAAMAMLVPAYRAATVNPTVALRQE